MPSTTTRVSTALTALLAAFATAAPTAPAKRGFEVIQRSDEAAWAIEHGADVLSAALGKRWANWHDFGEFDGSSSAKFQDGQGTYIRSGDEARYNGGLGLHCWTDLVRPAYQT
jgi:hypothetical protein